MRSKNAKWERTKAQVRICMHFRKKSAKPNTGGDIKKVFLFKHYELMLFNFLIAHRKWETWLETCAIYSLYR